MKKIVTVAIALLLTLCCVFSTNVQAQEISLSELREVVDELNSACPSGNGDMDILSCTLDNSNVCFTFLLSEDSEDDSFSISDLNEALADPESAEDLKAVFLASFLSDEIPAGIAIAAAMNNRGLKIKFISKKTKKSTSFTITASEINAAIEYLLQED